MRRGTEAGASLIEMLVSMAISLMALSALGGVLVQNTRINKSQQMVSDVQSNARIALSLIVQRLRGAGWDPRNAGIATVALDPDLTDDVSQIEIFADRDEDGMTLAQDEQVTIRHDVDRITWRRTGNVADPFLVLAADISNDSDGDGTPEPMFVPDSTSDPTRITVRITARSSATDPVSGDFLRYTVQSDVVFRERL
jgi:Tfp pilus assembly protein PilW